MASPLLLLLSTALLPPSPFSQFTPPHPHLLAPPPLNPIIIHPVGPRAAHYDRGARLVPRPARLPACLHGLALCRCARMCVCVWINIVIDIIIIVAAAAYIVIISGSNNGKISARARPSRLEHFQRAARCLWRMH